MFYAMLFFIHTMQQDYVAQGRRPRPASPWTQTVQARCGATTLAISGYGISLPGGGASVRANGRMLSGESVNRFLGDLSNRRAAYRITVGCERTGRMEVRVYLGEAQSNGEVSFRSGVAAINGNRLEFYSGLQPSTAEGFWFR